MSYRETTIAASSGGAVHLDWIFTQLNPHASWERLERTTAGTYTYDIYNNVANTPGVPMIIIFRAHSATAWDMTMTIAESYDSATDTVTGYLPSSATTVPDTTDYSTGPTGVTIGSASIQWSFSGNGQSSVAKTVSLFFNNDTVVYYDDNIFYPVILGVCTTRANPTPDPSPLFMAAPAGATTAYTSSVARTKVTREPLLTSSSDFTANVSPWVGTPAGKDPILNGYYFSPLRLMSRGGSVYRGLLHTDLKSGFNGARGDRITIGGVEHAYPGNNGLWVPSAA